VHPGTVVNSAGGRAFALDRWGRLRRFLILGAAAGSYYATPKKLTADNAEVVLDCIAEDGLRVVQAIVEVSRAGAAPRADAALLALALALKLGDPSARKAAADAVPAVCRTGAQLLQLAQAVDAVGGWGRVTRRAFARWYQRPDVDALAYQLSKYRQREGWAHRDVLRLCHAEPPTAAHSAALRWAARGELLPEAPARLHAAAAAHAPHARVDELVRAHGLVREELPSAALREADVWRALLTAAPGMPLTALLRNLSTLTRLGVLVRKHPLTRQVVERLTDPRQLRAARLHPLQILVALNTYRAGKGVDGKATWAPLAELVQALEVAFHRSFDAVPSTGKRWMLAIDVSGSMHWSTIAGMTGITPAIGAAAMAMVNLRVEPQVTVTAFSTTLTPVPVDRRMDLAEVQAAFAKIPMGGTDCAQPMLYALRHRIPVDVFAIYTDSETWAGEVSVTEALRRYRAEMGIDARVIVVGMVANAFTLADPDDPGMLDVVGFDTSAPALMAAFARGELV
jgi:60 kDa SS-A/Ro ribonucleoprotein